MGFEQADQVSHAGPVLVGRRALRRLFILPEKELQDLHMALD
jgi:hypothetical protein